MKQTEGTETANVSFDLGAATMNYGNNAPYFQWGRKDPMPPSTGLTNTSKPIYGAYTTINDISTTNMAETIRTPYYFNNSDGNPSLELWNVGNTSTTVNVDPVIKSIYDPSPIGFHVPCTGATEGWDANGRSYLQSTAGKQGRYLYQLGPNTGNTFFFPALGERRHSNWIRNVGTDGNFWASGPSSTSGAFCWYFNVNYFNTQYSINRLISFSIIPVSE